MNKYICAAVKVYNDKVPTMYVGVQHANIIITDTNPNQSTEKGYLASNGSFVDRDTALLLDPRNLFYSVVPETDLDLPLGQSLADDFNSRQTPQTTPKKRNLTEFDEIYKFVNSAQLKG